MVKICVKIRTAKILKLMWSVGAGRAHYIPALSEERLTAGIYWTRRVSFLQK